MSEKPLFPLGQCVMTPGVEALIRDDQSALLPLLQKHQSGDWGDLDEEDKAENDSALKEGCRLMSSYVLNGKKIWIITESDRSVTTALLPDEY